MPRLKPEFILSAAQTLVTMWNPFPQAVRGQHAIDEFSSPMVMLFATEATHNGDLISPRWSVSPVKDLQDLDLNGHIV